MTKLLRISAILTVIGLAFMVWSLVQPTPMPVLLAMSAGQGIGMLAFAIYLYVIVVDLRRGRRARRISMQSIAAVKGESVTHDSVKDDATS